MTRCFVFSVRFSAFTQLSLDDLTTEQSDRMFKGLGADYVEIFNINNASSLTTGGFNKRNY